jgi:hypothetical protein
MRGFLRVSALSAVLALTACGSTDDNKETGNRAIKRETTLVDARLYEGSPNKTYNDEHSARVGFDAAGKESRMLLYFPKLENLWEKDVIVTSIAVVEVTLNCLDVQVNPENIELVPVSRSWTPFVTWKTRDTLTGKGWSSAGGDVDASLPAVTPTLRPNSTEEGAKELAFDITNLVQRMVLGGYHNYGFMIRVKRSELNAKDEMWFKTTNSWNSDLRPSAILAFSSTDSVE